MFRKRSSNKIANIKNAELEVWEDMKSFSENDKVWYLLRCVLRACWWTQSFGNHQSLWLHASSKTPAVLRCKWKGDGKFNQGHSLYKETSKLKVYAREQRIVCLRSIRRNVKAWWGWRGIKYKKIIESCFWRIKLPGHWWKWGGGSWGHSWKKHFQRLPWVDGMWKILLA